MAKILAPFPWIRGSVALLVTLFVLVIALPRAGKVVTDHTTSPPTTHVEGEALQSIIMVVVSLPLLAKVEAGKGEFLTLRQLKKRLRTGRSA